MAMCFCFGLFTLWWKIDLWFFYKQKKQKHNIASNNVHETKVTGEAVRVRIMIYPCVDDISLYKMSKRINICLSTGDDTNKRIYEEPTQSRYYQEHITRWIVYLSKMKKLGSHCKSCDHNWFTNANQHE